MILQRYRILQPRLYFMDPKAVKYDIAVCITLKLDNIAFFAVLSNSHCKKYLYLSQAYRSAHCH